jgi:hypothetical protein
MKLKNLCTNDQPPDFLAGAHAFAYRKERRYQWIQRELVELSYLPLSKRYNGIRI